MTSHRHDSLSTKPKVLSDPAISTKIRAKMYKVLHRGEN